MGWSTRLAWIGIRVLFLVVFASFFGVNFRGKGDSISLASSIVRSLCLYSVKSLLRAEGWRGEC